MQRAPRIEVLPHRRQEIALLALLLRRARGEKGVRECFLSRGARGRVDEGGGLEAVVCYEDGLHLFEVGVAVERRVAAQQKVRNHAYRPDIDWFPVARLLEDLRRHVARRPARGGQHVEVLVVHDAAQAEVGDEQVGVVLGGAEEQVLGLEVAVHDAVGVE
ncbi:hypothetical protein V491_08429, partial [Pseudogymnoascus sp. VKM F-3775]